MDRRDVLKRLLYPKCKTAIEFQFDTLIANPMLTYITVQDIAQLNKIATSIKYSSKPKEKYAMIDKILAPRGFKKMASGTNRVVYRFLNDYRVVLKVAIDKVGLSDNGNEYRNQQLLKPFVTKCFEVSPCGTVGLFERVVPITSREEFINISEDVFDLINNLIGKYVLEDIGEKFYMNYGLREGFGPVLLDYPYVFELDGRKLICNVPEPMSPKGYCGGEIDYDLGYNNLICKRCGKRYLATELKSDEKSDKPKIIIKGDDIVMKCVLKRGDEVVSELNSKKPLATNTIKPRKQIDNMKATLSRRVEEEPKKEYTTQIKTHDDIQLKAELRGNRKSKDIDKEARKKEKFEQMNTKNIKVSFDSPDVFKNNESEENNFDASLIKEEDISKDTNKVDHDKSDSRDITIDSVSNQISKPVSKIFTAAMTENGEIWDIDKFELVGYSNSDCNVDKDHENITIKEDDNSDDESLVNEEKLSNDASEIEHENESGYTIADLVAGKLSQFKGNENYKTNDIVSPIEQHFSHIEESNNEDTESEVEDQDTGEYSYDEDESSNENSDYIEEKSEESEEELLNDKEQSDYEEGYDSEEEYYENEESEDDDYDEEEDPLNEKIPYEYEVENEQEENDNMKQQETDTGIPHLIINLREEDVKSLNNEEDEEDENKEEVKDKTELF